MIRSRDTFYKFVKHPEFGGGLASLDPHLKPAALSGYIRHKTKEVQRRYTRNRGELEESLRTYNELASKVESAFYPEFDDYDKQLWEATCDMGHGWKPAHTDLDEMSKQVWPNDVDVPDDCIEAWYGYFKNYLTSEDEKLTMTRGRNNGYPFPFSGSDRRATNAFLYLSVAVSIGAKKAGLSLHELFEFLTKYHGPPMCVNAYRYQTTANPQPIVLNGEIVWMVRKDPRARGINMSPKVAIAYNRKPTKKLQNTLLKSPIHDSDKKRLMAWYTHKTKNGWVVIPCDGKKAERHAGGKRAIGFYKLVRKLVGNKAADDLWTEFQLPLLLFGKRGAFILPGGLILGSGMGTTTAHNCIASDINFSMMINIMTGWSFKEIIDRIKKADMIDFKSYGDDVFPAFSPEFVSKYGGGTRAKLEEKIIEAYEKIHLAFEIEPVDRYLGVVYGKGTLKNVTMGYPMARAVQQHFWPEREKHYPFTLIGFIARMELLGVERGRVFYNIIKKQFWDKIKLGEPFAYEDRSKVLLATVPLVEKYSEHIGELDDLMQGLYHGMADSEESAQGWEFDKFLGLSKIDVSNPVSKMQELDVPQFILEGLRDLTNGKMDKYQHVMDGLCNLFKLRRMNYDMVY